MIGPTPICLNCQYYNNDMTCKAFPKGIPENILFDGDNHNKSVKGDNGIIFELKKKVSANELWESVK